MLLFLLRILLCEEKPIEGQPALFLVGRRLIDTLHRNTSNGKGFLVGFPISGQNKDGIRSRCEILEHLGLEATIDDFEWRP